MYITNRTLYRIHAVIVVRGDNAEGHTCRPLTPSGAAVCDVGTKVLCADNSVIDSDVRPWYVCQERPANF